MSSFSPIREESPDVEMNEIRMNLKNSFDNLSDGNSENMRVYCRVRPMLQSEEDAGHAECIAAIDDQVVRAVVPANSIKFKNSLHHEQEIIEDFKYTLAFGPEVGQFSFFRHTIMDIMQGFIEGQNGLIFSYGITNSGKTYTLQGDEANPGIIPLAMHLFFSCIEHQLLEGISVKPDKHSDIITLNHNETVQEQQLKDSLLRSCDLQSSTKFSDGSSSDKKSFAMILCDAFYNDFKFGDRETTLPPDEMIAAQSALYMKEVGKKSADEQPGLCSVWVSFIEIYNEYVYDLLESNINQRSKLQLAEDQNGEVYVKGAQEISVSSADEAIKLLNLGRRNLRMASTKLNYQSSRSHCIFTVKVIRLHDEENAQCGRVNRLSFCDLAGSERASKAETTGVRLKETGYINTSLHVLGRCMDQLRLNQTSRDKKLIPYRESKLTRLFYGHFMGKGKAAMIANASPNDQTFDETLNVLRFSALAKELTLNDSYLTMATKSLQNLSNQWTNLRGHVSDTSYDEIFDSSMALEVQEKDEMIEKLLDLADTLRSKLETERKEKAEMEIKIREDVCSEYSEYSDGLLENQRQIGQRHVEAVKGSYQKRLENMKQMYEKRLSEMKAQLEEYETCSEASLNESCEKEKDASLLSENIPDDDKSVTLSPSVSLLAVKQELDEQKHDINMFEKLECTSDEYENLISENKSLKMDLCTIKNELEATTEQLQKYAVIIVDLQNEIKEYEEKSNKVDSNVTDTKPEQSVIDNYVTEMNSLNEELVFVKNELEIANGHIEQTSNDLKKAKTDESTARENSEILKCKLQEANAVLEEYQKEFDQLKRTSTADEEKISILEEEKKNLQENVSTLSEQLAAAVAESEQLKKEKLENKEKYSDQSMEIMKIQTYYELKCEQLNQKLEDTFKTLEENAGKIRNLESECDTIRSDKDKLLRELTKREAELEVLSNEAALLVSKVELFENEKLQIEGKYSEQSLEIQKFKAESESLSLKLEENIQALMLTKSKIKDLELECNSYKSDKENLVAQNKMLEEKMVKMSEEIGKAICEEKYNELNLKFVNSTNALEKQQLELQLASETVQEQKSKLDVLELECIASKNEKARLISDYSNLKEMLNATKEELGKSVSEELYNEVCTKLINVTEGLEKKLKDMETARDIVKDQLDTLQSDHFALKSKNEELLEKYNILDEKFNAAKEELTNTVPKHVYNELVTKFEESNNKFEKQMIELQAATETVAEQRSLYEKLELEYSTFKNENAKLLADFKSLEEMLNAAKGELAVSNDRYSDLSSKFSEATESLEKQQLALEIATETVKEQKSKLNELEEECTASKNENAKLSIDYSSLEEMFNNAKKELALEKIDVDANIETKSDLEDALSTLEAQKLKNNEIETRCRQLDSQLGSSLLELEQQKSKLTELGEEFLTSQKNSAKLLEDYTKLKVEFNRVTNELEIATIQIMNIIKEKSALEDALSKALAERKEKGGVEEANTELQSKLEESSIIIEDQKLKIEDLESKCNDITSQLEQSTELKCKLEESLKIIENQKQKIEELENKCSDISSQLENSTHALESQKFKLKELEEEATLHETNYTKLLEKNCTLGAQFDELQEDLNAATKQMEILKKEKRDAEKALSEIKEKGGIEETNTVLKSKLEESSQTIEDQKLKIEELESKCNDIFSQLEQSTELKCKLEESLIIIENQKQKIEELENKCSDISSQLENSTHALESQKVKLKELESEATLHETRYTELLENNCTLQAQFNQLKEELNTATELIENLKKEKGESDKALSEIKEKNYEENNMKLKKELDESTLTLENQKRKIEELENKCSTYSSQLESTTQSLETKISELNELEATFTSQAEKYAVLQANYSSLEKEFNSVKKELEENLSKETDIELKSKLEESAQELEKSHVKINELTFHLENSTLTLQEQKSKFEELDLECTSYKDSNAKLAEDFKKLEDNFIAVKADLTSVNLEYEQLKKEKLNEEKSHATSISELLAELASTKSKIQELEGSIQTLEKHTEENMELKDNIKSLENKYESMSEHQGHLLKVLGKCELNATNKIKQLHSSSIKSLEDIIELKKQVEERDSTINKLKKEARDIHKLKSEAEEKFEKEIMALKHQHCVEVQEFKNLQKINEENKKLILVISQQENKENSKCPSKGLKQENKENSKCPSKGLKEENKLTENKDLSNGKRPLRSRQVNIREDLKKSDSEDNSGEKENATKTSSRKRKSEDQIDRPSSKRALRKKVQENSENTTPTQKIAPRVDTKAKRLAESIEKVPSPRMTRRRRKLCNV